MKVEILSVVTYICPGTSSSELITDGPIRRATYSVSPFLRGFDGPYKKNRAGVDSLWCVWLHVMFIFVVITESRRLSLIVIVSCCCYIFYPSFLLSVNENIPQAHLCQSVSFDKDVTSRKPKSPFLHFFFNTVRHS